MNKETLRMQFLSGVITESEYKTKLEILNEALPEILAFIPAIASIILATNTDKAYMNLLSKARKMGNQRAREKELKRIAILKKESEDELNNIKNSDEYFKAKDDKELQNLLTQYNRSITSYKMGDEQAGSAMTFYSKDKNLANEIIQKLNKDYPKIAKIIGNEILKDVENSTSSGIDLDEENKKQLDENFVGIGAINNPFPTRKKSDYELAFDHYMGNINEVEGEEETDMEEMGKENPIDAITMDVPLFIRMLEFAREDASTDMDLHDLADKAIAMSTEGEMLSMDNYEDLVGAETSEEN
jgi:hypothetical protein